LYTTTTITPSLPPLLALLHHQGLTPIFAAAISHALPRSGVSAGGVLLLLLMSCAATAGGMLLAYRRLVQPRLAADVRAIMEEYVPLSAAPEPSTAAGLPLTFTDSATPRCAVALASSSSSGGNGSGAFKGARSGLLSREPSDDAV
jgi:hypothetical protein